MQTDKPPPHGRQGHAENGALCRRAEENEDVIFGHMRPLPPLIPEADYVAGFLRAADGYVERRNRWFIYFKIATPGDYAGTALYLSCPYPTSGGKVYGLSSKMVAAATVALGRLPTRRDRLSPRMLFKGKWFLVRVRTVRRDRDGKLRPQGDWYSVIEKLIALHAGPEGRSK